MNSVRELHSKSFQMLRNQNSSSSRHDKSNHNHKHGKIQTLLSLKNSLLYYRVFFITSIHLQVWLHITRLIQICYICVLPKRKISYVLSMTSKQTVHQGQMSDILRTLRLTPAERSHLEPQTEARGEYRY